MKPYRMLLLSAATSDGRESEAEAFEAWAHQLLGDQVEVKVARPLEHSTRGYLAVDWSNALTRVCPAADAWVGPGLDWMANSASRRELDSVLNTFRPQLVLSLHPALNIGPFARAKALLGEAVRCVTYCREWAAGEGLSGAWVSPHVDRWMGRSERVVREAYRLGVEPDKLDCLPFCVPPGQALTRTGQRLDEEKLTLFLTNDRSAALDPVPLLKALEPFKDRVQAIVVCGLSQRRRRAVTSWQKKSGMTVLLETSGAHLADYASIADAVVGRADAGTLAEGLLHACPVWMDVGHGLTRSEMQTMKFGVGEGLAKAFEGPRGLAHLVGEVLGQPHRLAAERLQLKQQRDKYAGTGVRAAMEKLFAWAFFKARLDRLAGPNRQM